MLEPICYYSGTDIMRREFERSFVLTHCQILWIDFYSTRAISVGGIFGGIYFDVNIKHH